MDLEQPENRVEQYSQFIKILNAPMCVLNPMEDQYRVSIATHSFSLAYSTIFDFRRLYYDCVFFKLPTLCPLVTHIIEETYECLANHGSYCIYACSKDKEQLEQVLGPVGSTVTIEGHDEVIYIWTKQPYLHGPPSGVVSPMSFQTL